MAPRKVTTTEDSRSTGCHLAEDANFGRLRSGDARETQLASRVVRNTGARAATALDLPVSLGRFALPPEALLLHTWSGEAVRSEARQPG